MRADIFDRPRGAIGEGDRDLDDAAAGPRDASRDLDLERVARGPRRLDAAVAERLGTHRAKARGEIGRGEIQHEAGVHVAET